MIFAFLMVFISSISFTQGLQTWCTDVSKPIENGNIVCKFPSGSSTNPSYRYKCLVLCNVGYYPDQRVSTTCLREDRWQSSRYQGRWTSSIDQLTCAVSTTCPDLTELDIYYPENGRVECITEGERKKCTRTCDLPYVPSEPEFVVENCGPETRFIWSYTLRHNTSMLPPCELKSKCLDLNETAHSTHGEFICHEEEWASTTTCDFVCHRGNMPTSSDQEVFCGPATGFWWTHEWISMKNGGCEIAPVSAVVTLSAPSNADQDRENAQTITTLFDSVSHDLKGRKMWRLVNWRSENSEENKEVTKYYFNFKDLCIDGTCVDGCNALKMQNATKSDQCYMMCDHTFHLKEESLRQMRNITIHHIAKTLLYTKPSMAHHFSTGEFKSLEVDIGQILLKGGNPFDPGSGYCRP